MCFLKESAPADLQEKGNALFLILVAVALFAALSYAITQSGRSSGDSSREARALQAARIIQYGADIQQAVMRVTLNAGCADTELDFSPMNLAVPPRTDSACSIFNPAGGNVAYDALTSIAGVTATLATTGTKGLQGIGADDTADLYLRVTLNNALAASWALCAELDRQLGIATSYVTGTSWSPFMVTPIAFGTTQYIGAFNAPPLVINTISPALPAGSPAFCTATSAGVALAYYHVLLAR